LRHTQHILSVIGTLCGLAAMGQHTPLTSQYLFNGLLINPAYAGSRDALAVNLTHRQQWVGFDGAPVTQIVSVHAPVNKRKVGLGLLLFNDRIGVSNETGVFTNYAYRIKFPKGRLALGIGAGFSMLRGNWQNVAIQDQGDLTFAEQTRSGIRPNFSTGAFYYGKKFFVGASLPFLLMHQYGVGNDGLSLSRSRPGMQPMLTGGYVIPLSRTMKLKPSALLRYRMETGVQADLSTHIIFHEKLWLGLSYRTQDAAIVLLEVLPTPQWRFGYAYDLGLSALRQYHQGSHEIMVQYEFGYRIRVKDPRYF